MTTAIWPGFAIATAPELFAPVEVYEVVRPTVANGSLGGLARLRQQATGTAEPPLSVIAGYGSLISPVIALNAQAAQGTSDASISVRAQITAVISQMKEEVSQERTLLYMALRPGQSQPAPIGAGALRQLTTQIELQNANLASFRLLAQSNAQSLFQGLSNAGLEATQRQILTAVTALAPGSRISAGSQQFAGAIADAAQLQQQLETAENTEQNALASATVAARSRSLRTVVIDSLIVALALLLTALLVGIIARSMTRPLRRLRSGALEVADVRLPGTVRQISESGGDASVPEIEPIDVASTDEIGQVARAFDQVHREAVRLAANEAAVRSSVNSMFVNLSRRSQSLIERQIRLIDRLEQTEQDPQRLGSLFQMDHLATRMRRNSENLLVLAGHDVPRRRNQPVPLVDVLRAAVSEIEQYERVTVNVQPGVSVRGQAVNDVVHLTAELLENATSFSPSETPVRIDAHAVSGGGVLVEITDQGVGMGSEEAAQANWRLENPPIVDVAVSRRMGLFVVARLAARHGIRVRLRPAEAGGMTALAWLPASSGNAAPAI